MYVYARYSTVAQMNTRSASAAGPTHTPAGPARSAAEVCATSQEEPRSQSLMSGGATMRVIQLYLARVMA